MKTLSKADYYQVRWMNGSRLVDEDSLRDLYLPLLRPEGYALYQTLRGDAGTLPMKSLLLRLDLTSGEFAKAVAPLEAVGLVRTFVEPVQGGTQLWIYCLYPPKTVKEFFDDYLLQGTLHGFLGNDAFAMLEAKYKAKEEVPDAEEVSQSFPKVFNQSFPQEYYLHAKPLSSASEKASERLGFDRGSFVRAAEGLGLRADLISEAELGSIEKIATLYSISEKSMAEFVYDCIIFNAPLGKKVDMAALSEKCRTAMPFAYLRQDKGESSKIDGDSVMAEKIRLMDSVPPSKYLSIRQGGHKPAKPDLKLVEKLSMEIGLSDPCINALIDYVLDTNDNILASALCEKLAASLVREGCRSAKDAMDYLLRSHKKTRRYPPKKASTPKPVSEPTPVPPSADEDEEVSDEEVQALLDKLYKDKKS